MFKLNTILLILALTLTSCNDNKKEALYKHIPPVLFYKNSTFENFLLSLSFKEGLDSNNQSSEWKNFRKNNNIIFIHKVWEKNPDLFEEFIAQYASHRKKGEWGSQDTYQFITQEIINLKIKQLYNQFDDKKSLSQYKSIADEIDNLDFIKKDFQYLKENDYKYNNDLVSYLLTAFAATGEERHLQKIVEYFNSHNNPVQSMIKTLYTLESTKPSYKDMDDYEKEYYKQYSSINKNIINQKVSSQEQLDQVTLSATDFITFLNDNPELKELRVITNLEFLK